MKRIPLVYALLLSASLALTAADAPAPTPQPATPAPAACSLEGVKSTGLTPEPIFQSSIPPPCYAMTNCPDGSTISCPNVSYYSACWSSPGCWVQCEEGFIFCPGREYDPECMIW